VFGQGGRAQVAKLSRKQIKCHLAAIIELFFISEKQPTTTAWHSSEPPETQEELCHSIVTGVSIG
jgi:hypothetical protein